ncbi:MAG: hypothetical protein ABFD16_08400 [Thermoguttaceae bacterium]|jgi:hypothetical protein
MTKGACSTSDFPPLSEGEGLARLVVCESTGGWAVTLRRELAGLGIRVYETRSVAQAWEMLASCPASFLVVELSRTSLDALLERMTWLERDYPLARVAVVAERGLERCEVLMRAAGAVHFTTSPRQLSGMARVATRHVQSAPRPRRSIADEIWASLPWR